MYEELDNRGSEIVECVFYLNDDGLGDENLESKMLNNTYDRVMYKMKVSAAMTDVLGNAILGFPGSKLAEVCPKYIR